MTDNELIESVFTHDERAFEELVRRYRKQVIRTCYGFVHDTSEAEDISQDVFVEVYRSLDSFRGDAEFSTWLYRISIHKSLNYLRSKKRRKIFSSLDHIAEDHDVLKVARGTSIVFDPYSGEQEDERIELLQQGIDCLPKKQRTALVLHRYDNLSHREICDVLGLSVSAVESLIHRAKVNLRKYILHHYKERE